MEEHKQTPNSPEDDPSSEDFWQHRTLKGLAKAQGVLPIEDVRVFYGTWPGEQDDGFEALIDEHRHVAPVRS